MLAAVTRDAPDYEGLRNYVIGGGRPTAVPAFDASARQPTGAPGSALPGAPTPIPTSSAHPGKQTNQRITYARLQTKYPSPANGGLDPEAIHEGDVVFVHRYDGINAGHDVNKPTCMATIAQLNAVFGHYNPHEAEEDLDDGAVRPARRSADAGILFMEAIDPETGLANNPRGRSPPPEPQEGDEQAVWDEYAEWTRDRPKYRWKHCKALAAWAPDGVCCATEHEHSKDPMVGAGASNPGELFNIAIGGPTLVRNAAHHKHNMHVPEQHIDDGMRVLDKVFVGLVCHRAARRQWESSRTTRTRTSCSPRASSRGPPSSAAAAPPGPVSDALVPGGVNTGRPERGRLPPDVLRVAPRLRARRQGGHAAVQVHHAQRRDRGVDHRAHGRRVQPLLWRVVLPHQKPGRKPARAPRGAQQGDAHPRRGVCHPAQRRARGRAGLDVPGRDRPRAGGGRAQGVARRRPRVGGRARRAADALGHVRDDRRAGRARRAARAVRARDAAQPGEATRARRGDRAGGARGRASATRASSATSPPRAAPPGCASDLRPRPRGSPM